MEFWMIYVIISVIAILVEVFVPTLFCINFAFAGVITALVSIFWGNAFSLMALFIVLSVLSLIFVKPLLSNLLKKDAGADFDSQYIGKIVRSIETISNSKGAVSIYEERWEARTINEGEEIPVDCDVKIVKNDSLVLYVEKV